MTEADLDEQLGQIARGRLAGRIRLTRRCDRQAERLAERRQRSHRDRLAALDAVQLGRRKVAERDRQRRQRKPIEAELTISAALNDRRTFP